MILYYIGIGRAGRFEIRRPVDRRLPSAVAADESAGTRGRRLHVGHGDVLHISHDRRSRLERVRAGCVGRNARPTAPVRGARVRLGGARLQRHVPVRVLRLRLQSDQKSRLPLTIALLL